eukprot:CAMPEP_0197672966 /NCGR_PEP_ID=MMETSP1338-20131121/80050_1 /TAXON_ID=43686 ORGANISM="Pelagodinium beii, Strain RCC1491" /NCGR_SAMPLE_ID=MMETSP1338 /ASSEMBLY_ACC=CAM_ASM_000754 /LENGTH=68 /DNA_ID=CAMNT_0043253155 /DNA_START=563 /DNA_END=769 /DNA_ORIENTATION=+
MAETERGSLLTSGERLRLLWALLVYVLPVPGRGLFDLADRRKGSPSFSLLPFLLEGAEAAYGAGGLEL